jgi:hypothetical protein
MDFLMSSIFFPSLYTYISIVRHHPHHEVHADRTGEQRGKAQKTTRERAERNPEKSNRSYKKNRRRAADGHGEPTPEPVFASHLTRRVALSWGYDT